MGEEALRKILKDFGLTDSEAEVYLFVSMHRVLSATDTAHSMRKDKAQIFRTLKNLQTKGFVEATLEVPMRFAPVAFERVLELTIRAKKDEALNIENAREELLNHWKAMNGKSLDGSLEKFVVIEGNSKIYTKVAQMVKDTKKRLSVAAPVSSLFRADQFGVFETILTHPLKSEITFEFLTESSVPNLSTMKGLSEKATKAMFRSMAKDKNLVLPLSARMVLRDGEEALFFITPRSGVADARKDEVCLYTDCRELVLALTSTFEGMWQNSSGTMKPTINEPVTTIRIEDENESSRVYAEALRSADKGLMELPSAEFVEEKWRHYNRTKEPIMAHGWRARAVIRLPNLPKIPMIGVNVIHLDEGSAFGGGKMIEFALWMGTKQGFSFVPVACLVNEAGSIVMRRFYAGTPAANNLVLVEPHRQVEVFRKDRLVFAGWTVNVPLPPLDYVLGPSCLYFEGHGPIQHVAGNYSVPAGFTGKVEYKKCHAFVTFMNQMIPYLDAGIQGFLVTEYIMRTMHPQTDLSKGPVNNINDQN